jgi:glyoxylase-like metal-dependent hydrolase (beta-lactamase superfamily II)
MKQVADGVWQLRSFPPNAFNVYLAEDVVIDASHKRAGKGIFKQLEGHRIAAHALTHAHPDHNGVSRQICERYGVPFWVGEEDAEAAERPELMLERQPSARINTLIWRAAAGAGRPVDRRLREGDEVAGFAVLHVPGHSAGHVAFWRESDRTLILGDVLNGMHLLTGIPGLHEPPRLFTPDPARNRESARRLAALEPRLTLFGHGPPNSDTRKLVDFVGGLPG